MWSLTTTTNRSERATFISSWWPTCKLHGWRRWRPFKGLSEISNERRFICGEASLRKWMWTGGLHRNTSKTSENKWKNRLGPSRQHRFRSKLDDFLNLFYKLCRNCDRIITSAAFENLIAACIVIQLLLLMMVTWPSRRPSQSSSTRGLAASRIRCTGDLSESDPHSFSYALAML